MSDFAVDDATSRPLILVGDQSRPVPGLFELAQWARTGSQRRLLILSPLIVMYRLIVEWEMGIVNRPKTKLNAGRLHNGCGLSKNVTLLHGVTIGTSVHWSACPIIGDSVGHDAIHVRNSGLIGAGATVVKDVPARGNPAMVSVKAVSSTAENNFTAVQ